MPWQFACTGWWRSCWSSPRVTIELRGWPNRAAPPWHVLVVTHFSCGVTVFALMIARLFLRWRHPSPAIAPKPPKWQTGLAHLTHNLDLPVASDAAGVGVYSRYSLKRRTKTNYICCA